MRKTTFRIRFRVSRSDNPKSKTRTELSRSIKNPVLSEAEKSKMET
jgi:hypothetical protein